MSRPNTRALALFVATAFAFSWSIGLALWLLGDVPMLARVGLMTLYMFGPALGAFVAQRSAGERVRELGIKAPSGAYRWWLAAWLAPLMLAFAAFGVALAFPGVEPVANMSGLADKITASVPPEQIASVREQLGAIPLPAFIAILVVQALVAGISINAIAAFGEELGWRGFLYVKLAGLGFWARALVVGALWGVWHAPIILQGHNYPEHPVIGVFMMVAFCVLLAAPLDHVRERTKSVLAASVAHGSINASAGFAVLFVKGGSDVLVGLTGVAGFLVLTAVNVGVLLVRRRASA